jgi:hypothetical protein
VLLSPKKNTKEVKLEIQRAGLSGVITATVTVDGKNIRLCGTIGFSPDKMNTTCIAFRF